MNYYERHIGDYIKDTSHLSLMEHGIYSRLLDLYYTREVGLIADQVARLIGARSEDEQTAMLTVLAEFFTLDQGIWMHARCDREIVRYQEKQRKAKESANARWANTDRNANALPPQVEGNALQSPVSIPIPNTEAIASAAAKTPRPSRKCPAMFEPEGAEGWAAEHAPGIDWRLETEKFRDHTFKNSITDWLGAWRNWMRRAAPALHGATALTFKERDAANAAARIAEMTGGRAVAQPITRRNDVLQEIFDAAPRRLG